MAKLFLLERYDPLILTNRNYYYKVSGGPGRTKDGYQEVINFLNDIPIICLEINDLNDCTGTWCTYEVGIPISKEEYQEAFNKATNDKFTII